MRFKCSGSSAHVRSISIERFRVFKLDLATYVCHVGVVRFSSRHERMRYVPPSSHLRILGRLRWHKPAHKARYVFYILKTLPRSENRLISSYSELTTTRGAVLTRTSTPRRSRMLLHFDFLIRPCCILPKQTDRCPQNILNIFSGSSDAVFDSIH